MKKVNVLGTEYTVKTDNEVNDPKLKECDGYCDDTIKLCVIDDFEPDVMSKSNLDEYKKKVTRHELIHAFLFESGLAQETWAFNEEIVDWIAAQFPKILKAFNEADCI
ncbi:MAG: hypothetical protein KID00_00920 [Clostridium argentinense]|nr:hypothetical protein [Clostridium argentinense]